MFQQQQQQQKKKISEPNNNNNKDSRVDNVDDDNSHVHFCFGAAHCWLFLVFLVKEEMK